MKDEGRGTGVADEATTEVARIIGIVAEDPRRKQIGLGAYLVLPLQRLTRFHCAHQKTTPPGRSSPIPAEERQEDPQNGPSNEGWLVGSAVFVREHATLEYIRPTPLVEDAPNGKSMEVPAAAIVPELSPIADVHLKDSRDQGEKKSISERVSLFFKRVAAMWKRKW
ncbi:hypothetical protein BC829DRAFT_397924, partial [Chytridium lagenaria]